MAQFLSVEVGQAAIEKEHLPETALQMNQGFSSFGACSKRLATKMWSAQLGWIRKLVIPSI
jgi:hypothetical protein